MNDYIDKKYAKLDLEQLAKEIALKAVESFRVLETVGNAIEKTEHLERCARTLLNTQQILINCRRD